MAGPAVLHGLPRYVQISERLIREIAAGHLVDGARLPPERDMAAELGVSVGTLRKALGVLAEKGLLDRVQGSGNYVRHRSDVGGLYAFFRLELLRGGGLPTAEVIDVTRCAKPADAPGFGHGREAHRIRRLRRLDGEPVALEEIWLDGSLRRRISARDLSDSLYLFYRQALGLVIGAVEDKIGLAAVPDWSAGLDFLPAGAVAGFVERLGRSEAQQPVEYSHSWFDTGRARYVARFGKG